MNELWLFASGKMKASKGKIYDHPKWLLKEA
jgi:hypothetical protein